MLLLGVLPTAASRRRLLTDHPYSPAQKWEEYSGYARARDEYPAKSLAKGSRAVRSDGQQNDTKAKRKDDHHRVTPDSHGLNLYACSA